jgi:hypothetical protein
VQAVLQPLGAPQQQQQQQQQQSYSVTAAAGGDEPPVWQVPAAWGQVRAATSVADRFGCQCVLLGQPSPNIHLKLRAQAATLFLSATSALQWRLFD